MTLIYSMILCLFLKASKGQRQCVKEHVNDAQFSLNVTKHIKLMHGDCTNVPYEVTFPENQVTVPYKKIWFKGDPANTVTVTNVVTPETRRTDTLPVQELPVGEHGFGFKLEWGCNQSYVFPKTLRISVFKLTRRPSILVEPMEEGKPAVLQCLVTLLCRRRPIIEWKWKNRKIAVTEYDGRLWFGSRVSRIQIRPTAEDDNTNVTCEADYGDVIVEKTVTLRVKYSPKILDVSQCVFAGMFLVCTCSSRGNPLPPISWPLTSLTEYTVTSSSSVRTVTSTLTMPASNYLNSTVKCISSNELGYAEMFIPFQNLTKDFKFHNLKTPDATVPWIISGVSLSLNLALLILIICICKQVKSKKRKHCDETSTYASLNKADVEEDYSVISSHPT